MIVSYGRHQAVGLISSDSRTLHALAIDTGFNSKIYGPSLAQVPVWVLGWTSSQPATSAIAVQMPGSA